MADILIEDEEHENVYRHLKVVIGETKEVFEKLLEFYLRTLTIPETYEEFIEKNAHEIYHFCYSEPCCQCQCQLCNKKCPQCTCRPIRTTRKRILYPQQLDIFFDSSGTKIHGHYQAYRSARNNCCCPINPALYICDLDVTLARFLLVNFTTAVQPGTLERKALDDLVDMRNKFAHAAKTRMSNQEYQTCQQITKKQLLILAKVYGKEQETKDRLIVINHEPFNPKVCLQLFNTLLLQAQFDQEFQETVNKLTAIVKELTTLKTYQIIPEFINKDLEDKTIVEGHDACFEIWLKETNIPVKWYKNNKDIMTDSDKMSLITLGNIHKLCISRCCEEDKGIYTVKVKNTDRQAKLDIIEFYTRNLKDIHCIEGNNVTFDCEVLYTSSDMKVQWYKDGVIYQSRGKQSTAMEMKRHILDIPCVDVNDGGRYEIDIQNRRRSAELTVEHYYTRSLQNVNCIEGEDVSLDCEVLYSDMEAQWYKDNIKIKSTSKQCITTEQKRLILRIPCVQVHDSGLYKIDIQNRKRSAHLRVESYFTKDFEQEIKCLVVADPVTFVCEVLDYNTTAKWFLNDNEIESSSRVRLQTTGRQHKLSINNVVVSDSGEYTVIVNNRKRTTKLNVKDSEIIRHTYLKDIQTKTETRYYIRVMIVGKNGVGKSSLLRRLLDEEIEGVESTDGIDISIHWCKFRLSDRKWIFNADQDPKREYAMRIKRARREENVDFDDDKAISTNSQKIFSEKSDHERNDFMSRIQQAKHAESSMSRTAKANHAESSMSRTAKANHAESSMSRTAKANHAESSMSRTAEDNPTDQLSKTMESEQNPEYRYGNYRKEQQTPTERVKLKRKLPIVLTETVAKEIDNFLLHIEEYEEENEVCVEIRFWDFAGEKDYYGTHHIFLDPNAVYLLVSDCSEDMKQAEPCETYDSIGEYIDFWFDTIHNCADVKEETTTKQFDPPIIAVCTGRDKLTGKVKKKEDIYRQMLSDKIQGENKRNHLRDICFVSNTRPSDTDFSHLRNLIFEHGKKLQSFGEVLPLKWIRLEQSLDVLRQSGIHFVSRNDIINLSVKCDFHSEEREKGVENFLNHQHKIGNIMYYSDIEDFVILSQQWLADAFKCLVSDKIDSNITLSDEWRKLEKTGILEKSLISKLFEKNPDLSDETIQENVITVLNKFGIIGIKFEEGHNLYYMPYMITSTYSPSLSEITKTFGALKEEQKSPWLCLEFDFFPLAYFTHVMLHFIGNYAMCFDKKLRKQSIYHGVGVFFVDQKQVNKLILLFCKNTIAIQIWHFRDPVPKTRYNDILQEIVTVVDQLKNKYKARNLRYSVKLKCSKGGINSPIGRVSHKYLQDKTEYVCEDHDSPTYHDSIQLFNTWFYNYSDKAEDICPEECTDSEIIRHTYLKDIQTKTETRYYIRVMIVGKNGVGKSSLLRRLLDEEIEGVESTDGIDISIHWCKFRLSDRKWIFNADQDPKREYAMRIKRARREENVDFDDDKAISTNSQKIFLEKSDHERNDFMSQIQPAKHTESSMPRTAKANHAESSMSRTAEDNPTDQLSETMESEQNPEYLYGNYRKEQQTPTERVKLKRKLPIVLTETVAKEIDNFLLQVEEYEEENEVCVEIRFWDFAGEKDYYGTHHIFLDPNAVYLLVSDCSEDMKQAEPCETYDSIGECIDFWFDTIHNCAEVQETTTEQFDPPIIAVCTGQDKLKGKVKEIEKQEDEYRQKLTDLIQYENKRKHLRDICFVSNTHPSDAEFSLLRKQILKYGETLQSYKEDLPLKWIRLEQSLEVLRDSGIPFVSRNDIIDLSVKCDFQAKKREQEVESFLNHQHKIGNIMYYSDIEDFVILRQQWLADAFKCLVSNKIDNSIKVSDEWKRLEKTGIIEKSFISKLFEKKLNLNNETIQENMITILNKFGIIGINEDHNLYYMPYMIKSDPTSLSDITNTFGVLKEEQKSPWLCLEFDFLPFAYFTHVMLHFIGNYTMCFDTKLRKQSIYHGVGVFFVGQEQVKNKVNKLILLFCKNTIAIQVWHFRDPVQKTRYNDILREIETVIYQLKEKYKAANLRYSVKLKCSEGDINSPIGRVSHRDLPDKSEDGEYFCKDHNTYHDAIQLFNTWFSENPHAYMDRTKQVHVLGIPEEYIDRIPTDEILDALAPVVGDYFFELGIVLEIPVYELKNIQRHFSSTVAQTREMLRRWRDERRVKATFERLQEALVEVGIGTMYLKEKIEEIGVKEHRF